MTSDRVVGPVMAAIATIIVAALAFVWTMSMQGNAQEGPASQNSPAAQAPSVSHQTEKALHACTALTVELRQVNRSVSRWTR